MGAKQITCRQCEQCATVETEPKAGTPSGQIFTPWICETCRDENKELVKKAAIKARNRKPTAIEEFFAG